MQFDFFLVFCGLDRLLVSPKLNYRLIKNITAYNICKAFKEHLLNYDFLVNCEEIQMVCIGNGQKLEHIQFYILCRPFLVRLLMIKFQRSERCYVGDFFIERLNSVHTKHSFIKYEKCKVANLN